MISQVTVDVVVSARCSCPILVQLRWVVELLYLNLMNVALWDDKAIHARCLDVATCDLVDHHGGDTMSDLMVVAVLFLDVEVDVLLEWSPRLVFDKVVDEEVDVDLLEVVVVVDDAELVCLHKDDLADAGWALGVDDPKTPDIHLGSRSLDILPRDVVLQVMNLAS